MDSEAVKSKNEADGKTKVAKTARHSRVNATRVVGFPRHFEADGEVLEFPEATLRE